ncbi:receptor-like protein 38 [Glycine max]|uniref:receptor-like protein 38 n=1 Tax=Glycine max TaxID=3847 RepID=UPI001B354AE5|nr:receptor-like protein 38 [Glycine max]
MGALVNMEALVLRNNGLMGELPSSLKNCSSLFMLDLSENMLSGPIPSWIGESMHQLIILNMRGNHLSGNLPIHLCYLKRIQLLDLSRNNLSSGIPSCLKNLTALSEQSINSSDIISDIYWNDKTSFGIYGYTLGGYTLDITWMWKGVERGFKDPELELKSIDLSSNNLMGEIPKEVGYLLGAITIVASLENCLHQVSEQINRLCICMLMVNVGSVADRSKAEKKIDNLQNQFVPTQSDAIDCSILGFNWLSNGVEIKCIEMERQALLKFKQGILVEPGILSTWSDDDRNSDC